MDVTPRDPAEQAWRLMRSLVLDRFDQRKAASAALDLSILRVKTLGLLSPAALTLRDLATRLGVDPPYATVLVDGLEERGYVQRQPHETDRRAKLVSLTATGREAAAIADRILNNPPAAVRELPDVSLTALIGMLTGLAGTPAAPSASEIPSAAAISSETPAPTEAVVRGSRHRGANHPHSRNAPRQSARGTRALRSERTDTP